LVTPEQVPGVLHPAQLPQLALALHAEQVANVGVPVHDGPVLNTRGGAGNWAAAVEQQIRFAPEQSLSVMHDFGQLFRQMPPQQSSPVAAQSLDCVHVFGHGSYLGSRHRPEAVTFGSRLWTD
jgi:hypothetical protein